MNLDKFLYFFCHDPQTKWYGIFAKYLKDKEGINSVCLVQSTRHKLEAEATGEFGKVINVLSTSETVMSFSGGLKTTW